MVKCWQGTEGSLESERIELGGREPGLALLKETFAFLLVRESRKWLVSVAGFMYR